MNPLIEQLETLPRYSPQTMQIAQARVMWANIKARANQLPPDTNWKNWLILSGRGWGKTRTGSEWIVWKALQQPKTRWAVVASTSADITDTCFEGESGIISVLNRYGIYSEEAYNRTRSAYTLPNGSRIKGFSAEKPDRLRGPQHHGAWCDELAAWEYPETWDQLQFGLRLGEHPQTVVTTTPRPTKIIKELIKDSDTIVTRGSTYENADNLAASTLVTLQAKYADTRLGRQELFGEILDDNPGALWNRSMLETARVKEAPYLTRIVVGIDPAVTSGEDSDSTGIVVAGLSADAHYYILADYTLKASPQVWAEKAVYAFELHKADRIIAETNNGGDLVVHLLQQVKNTIPVKKVTASRGKAVRAEPIAALSEQGKLHMVGYFPELEDELCEYEPGVSNKSPDRMDAMVWAVTELSEGSNALNYLSALAVFCPHCRMPAPKSTKFCPKCNTPIGEPNAITSDKPNA
jgi:predicted phage terminase large subunit-like protein